MSGTDSTCAYVLDPDAPETWGGEQGEECLVDQKWSCPHKADEGREHCIFHRSVDKKDDVEVVKALLNRIESTASNPHKGKSQFLAAEFGEFGLGEAARTGSQSHLSGADTDIALSYAKFCESADFGDMTFGGDVSFSGVEFEQEVSFQSVEFGGEADFRNVMFGGDASFGSFRFIESEAANFGGNASFQGAEFVGEVDFGGAKFEGNASFLKTEFNQEASFSGAKFESQVTFGDLTGRADFGQEAFFGGAVFNAHAEFRNVNFGAYTGFRSAEFNQKASFRNAGFGKKVDFSDAEFEQETNFSGVELTEAYFLRVNFEGNIDFSNVVFNQKTNFSQTDFNQKAIFTRAEFTQGVDFTAQTLVDGRFDGADLTHATFTDAILRGANFENAILSRATLFNADLRGARLSGTILGDVRVDEGTRFLGSQSNNKIGGSRSARETLLKLRKKRYCVYDHNYEGENGDKDIDSAKSVYRALEELGGRHARPRLQARSFVRRQDLQQKQYWDSASDADNPLEWIINVAKGSRAKVAQVTLLYGESPWRVIGYSLGIILSFAFLYPLVGGIKPKGGKPVTYARIAANPLKILTSLYYSTLTYTALGFGDFQPVGVGRLLTTVETGLGAVMLALLVFILGRRAAR